jgi:hypothetical protein
MMDGILALGLLFTTATQFRLPGMPVGPGELALLVWIAGMAFRTLGSGEPFLTRAVSALLAFWGAFALALSLGMITAMASREVFEPDLVLHDAMAYGLIAVVSCLCATTPSRLRRVSWLLVTGSAVSLSLQYINGMGLVRIPGIDPWYWERFRGWSDNPNQLSFLCLMMVLVAWHLADTAATLTARLVAVLLMIPALMAGRMSQSDTFMLALAGALPVWIAAKLIVWAQNDRPGLSLRGSIAQLLVVSVPILLLCVAPLVLPSAEAAKGFVIGFAKNSGAQAADEANLRMTLWRQAIERGIESGMLGLGPGPHLEIPPAIVAGRVGEGTQPTNLDHPSQNGTANYEAHNTVLDVFTQGGLLAVTSVVWLLLRAAKCVYRAQSAGLVALVAGAAICMMTGNIVRQPILWFALALCLTARVFPFERAARAHLAM